MICFISVKMEWFVFLYIFLYVFVFLFYCLGNLLILDFCFYKIGKNILESMGVLEGVKFMVYESVFVLEKNGEKKEFFLENYLDSIWKFIEVWIIVKEKGYEFFIYDFLMINFEMGEDIIEEVLFDKNYMFLLVVYCIEEVDDSNIDLINEIYDYVVEYGYGFYCLIFLLDDQIE